MKTLNLFAALVLSLPVVAQTNSGSSGGINVNLPGIGSVGGTGIDAGVRILGKEVVGVGAGVTNPPVQTTAPKTTLPDMFMVVEQNLAAALTALNALLANPQTTPAQITAAQALIETLRTIKAPLGNAITPATPAGSGGR
jgi:hypothetical protein